MSTNCTTCPHVVGDAIERDCAFPDCAGWSIEYDPKPIPDRSHDYDFSHIDYDGADGGNGLSGTASSYEDAVSQIIEIISEIASESIGTGVRE